MIRALLWLEWRLLVNGMRSRGRGGIDDASRLVRVVLPLLAAVVMVPAGLLAAGLGVFAGWALVRLPEGGDVVPVGVTLAASAVTVWSVVQAFIPGLHGGSRNQLLLRLLPVPHALLHRMQLLRLLLDPVHLMTLPGLLLLPVGILAAARPGAALLAELAAVVFVAFIAVLGGLAADVVQLLFRSRRRAEAVSLVFILLLSVAGLVPYALGPHHGERAAAPGPASPHGVVPAPASGGIVEALWMLPPAACAAAIEGAAGGRPVAALGAGGMLLGWGAVLYGLSLITSRRLVETPTTSSAGSIRGGRRTSFDVPLLAPATAAVARVQLRGFVRTVRGRLAMVSPVLVAGILIVAVSSGRQEGPLALLANPAYLAGFAFWSVLSNLSTTLGCNQLTLLGPGLLVELLQPLDGVTLLAGRAAALVGFFAVQEVLILAVLAAVFRGAPVALWPGLLLAGLAVLVSLLPMFALLSVVFPKTVDLNTVRRGGTVSAAAAVVNLLSIPVVSLPLLAAGWVSLAELHRPWLFPLLAGVWLGAMAALWRALLPRLARLVDSRREALAFTAVER